VFHALGETQFGAVVETPAAAMAEHPELGLQIGCGGFSLRQVCERIAVARSNGCSCIQLSLPGWLPLTDDEILDFYTAIVDRFPEITLCVYDNQASGRSIGSELWPRLAAAIPAIAGAKVTKADPELPALIRAVRPDFRFFAVESTFLEMWGSGIDGVTAWVSYALPEAIGRLWVALQSGDTAEISAGRQIIDALHEIKVPFRARGYRAGIVDRMMGLATGFLEPVFARVLRPWRSVDPADVALARARIVERLGPQYLWAD
jgi:dihydrodipicolinate synthase/N-acetylneuraminate lyase